jgi:anaphase-promoting complex subunit 2
MATVTSSADRAPEALWRDEFRHGFGSADAAHAVRTRPTTVAAVEFAADGGDWCTLPERVAALAAHVQRWNSLGAIPENSSEWTYAFGSTPQESRIMALTAAVRVTVPQQILNRQFSCYLQASLDYCCRTRLGEEMEGEEESVNGDEKYLNDALLFNSLRVLGWLRVPRRIFWTEELKLALRRKMKQYVRDVITGDYEASGLFETLRCWKDQTILPWLQSALIISSLTDPEEEQEMERWSQRLQHWLADTYCEVRNEEIFELVADYPDSHEAVLELRYVLQQSNCGSHEFPTLQLPYERLRNALRSALVRRVCHAGATTSQIIDVYIATIKVMRVMDPSDRLLQVVAEPVRLYLQTRLDTVRCITTSLTDADQGGELYEELRRQDAKPLEQVTVDSDDEEEPPTMDWQPRPSIHQPKGTFLETLSTNNNADGDILAMLVSIYGSKDLFVNEYRLMLADKLLASVDYNTDKEVHTLELLKLRFGESSMRNCEVMIKDMDDSKRANTNIQGSLKSRGTTSSTVDAAIISHIFWPTLHSDSLVHHPRIQVKLDDFSTMYANLKNPRKLVWMHQLGTVQLELDVIEDGPNGEPVIMTKEFSCSPLLATLISHFEDRTEWTAEDLSNETGVASHAIKKRMIYWINHRVITVHITPAGVTVYNLATLASHEENDAHGSPQHLASEDDDLHDHTVSISAQQDQEMDVFLSYVVGMLTNLGQLPLKTIHNNLKTFVTGSDVRYDKTPQQLSAFLQNLCRQERLECGPDGMYKLFKK